MWVWVSCFVDMFVSVKHDKLTLEVKFYTDIYTTYWNTILTNTFLNLNIKRKLWCMTDVNINKYNYFSLFNNTILKTTSFNSDFIFNYSFLFMISNFNNEGHFRKNKKHLNWD